MSAYLVNHLKMNSHVENGSKCLKYVDNRKNIILSRSIETREKEYTHTTKISTTEEERKNKRQYRGVKVLSPQVESELRGHFNSKHDDDSLTDQTTLDDTSSSVASRNQSHTNAEENGYFDMHKSFISWQQNYYKNQKNANHALKRRKSRVQSDRKNVKQNLLNSPFHDESPESMKMRYQTNNIVEAESGDRRDLHQTNSGLWNNGFTKGPARFSPADNVASFTVNKNEDTAEGPNVSTNTWFTKTDWKEVEKILIKKDNPEEILRELLEDHEVTSVINGSNFCAEFDIHSFKNELLSLPELRIAHKNPNKAHGFLQLWKKYAPERKGQGGTSLEAQQPDSGIFQHVIPSFLETRPVRHRKPNQTSEFHSGSCPETPASREGAVCPGENVNRNMPGELLAPYRSKFDIPVLQREKWKCRSAPELRHLMEREEPVRRVSQYDLTITHKCDVDGATPITIDPEETDEAVTSLIWGQEAYRHYKLLTMIETKEKLQMIKRAKKAIFKKYMWKQKMLENIVDVAKAYYSNPSGEKCRKWKQLRAEIGQRRQYSMTDLRHQLARIPDFSPFFTFFIMLVMCLLAPRDLITLALNRHIFSPAHILTLAVMCSVGKLAPAGVLSEKEVGREIQTFLGAETVHRYIIPNPWVGPPATTLLAAGASFALCIRLDQNLVEQGQMKKYVRLSSTSFGCCEMRGSVNAAGTTTLEECQNYTNNAGVWGPPYCGHRLPSQNSVAHVIRPCCVDHRGTCQMLSLEHCNFLGGTFHMDTEHCVQVLCVRDICSLGHGLSLIEPNPQEPWLASINTKWQWWRFPLALCYTFGILHCAPLLVLEWLLMRSLEKSAGWFRVLVTYMLCGIAGQLVACTVQPYIPHVGSTSAVAGMVGEAAVELRQAWTLLEKPKIELIKLSSFLAVLLIMGIFPFVSLWGTLVGSLCGAFCAIVFMPYISFHTQGNFRKALLMMLGLMILLSFFAVLLYIFVKLQPRPCKACRSVDCLSFSEDMCNQWDLLG